MEDKIENTRKLLESVRLIRKEYDKINELTGANYNVFNVLKLRSNEVVLHSRFIGDLLNPKGIHGRGDVFLKLFLEQVKGILPNNNGSDETTPVKEIPSKVIQDRKICDNFRTSDAKVIVEEYVGEVKTDEGGRIDLVVKDGKNSIVIENKIYAEDQNQQLIRYYNKYPNAIMLYLTLDGKEAASKSVTSAIKQEIKKNRVLIPDVDYFRISYKENNVSWLDACIPLVMEYPFLRESINQYLNIVKQLTGQSINKDMDNEIKELIINSSETYNAALSISRNINASRSALLGNYRALIQKELEDFLNHKEIKYKLEFTSDKSSKTKTQILFEEDSKYKLLNNNIIFEISRMLIPRSKTSKKFDVNSNFYFGLRYDHKENDKKESDIEELKGCLKSNFETNKWWLARVNHNLNFRDNYIKLADDDYMKKDVTDVIRNMKTMITKYIGLIND